MLFLKLLNNIWYRKCLFFYVLLTRENVPFILVGSHLFHIASNSVKKVTEEACKKKRCPQMHTKKYLINIILDFTQKFVII